MTAAAPSPPRPSPPSSRKRWSLALAALGLAIAVLVTFRSATAGDFLNWDDDINLTANPHLSPLTAGNLRWMATDLALMRRYVPVAWFGWGIEQALFGRDAQVTHVINLLLHAANAALVFLVVVSLLRHRTPPKSARSSPPLIVAAGAALLWAVHPLRVEPVAWASGRLYLQATFFLLLACWAYLCSQADGSRAPARWLGCAVACYSLSLFTYPIALGLVPVLLVIDTLVTRRLDWHQPWWADRRNRRTLQEKIPFALAAFLALGATLWARATAAGIWVTTEPSTLDSAGVVQRVMRALYHWLHVLWKPLVPFGLSPVYTELTDPNPFALPYLMAATAFVGVTGWLLWYSRRSAVPLVLWLAHLLFLLPYVGLTENMHYPNDRYTYVHAILVAATLAVLASQRLKPALVAAGAALALGWGALTTQQTKLWRNDETLFRHAIQSVGDDPYRGELTWRLGNALLRAGRSDEARHWYDETLRTARGVNARGAAHHGLALMDLETGAIAAACEHWRQANALAPNTIVYLQWYSFALLKSGRIQEALPLILRGRQLAPANPEFLQYEQGARRLLGAPAKSQP